MDFCSFVTPDFNLQVFNVSLALKSLKVCGSVSKFDISTGLQNTKCLLSASKSFEMLNLFKEYTEKETDFDCAER